MISYRAVHAGIIQVLLNKSVVGTIKMVPGGWQYFPKGQKKGGAIYATVQEIKRSLEVDND